MDIRSSKSESWAVRVALAAMLSYALMVPTLTLSAEARAEQAAKQEDAARKDARKGEDEELEEVNITGTRIQAPGNNTSANPMTTITNEEMQRQGIVNVGDALLQLVPQNISTYQPGLIGDSQSGTGGSGMDSLDRSNYFIGNTIANLRGMDPAFGTRTLTLVDGRRMVSTSNQADVVDLNIIPSNLLSRMDVVTGGASATYGSGAMAGVVNLVLNNRLTGFNLDMDYGINEAGDGGSPHISASGGLPLFGGKGHALLGVEWQKQQPILSCAEARAWCQQSRVLFNNSSASTSNLSQIRVALPGFEAYPRQFMMTDQRYSQFAPTGTVYHNSTSNTSGYRFNTNGTDIEEYSYGYRGGTGTSTVGGDGPSPSQPNGSPVTTQFTPMRPESDRKTLFGNFEYNLTERTTAYLQTNYAKTEGRNVQAQTSGSYCVRYDSTGTAGTNSLAGQRIYFTVATANLGFVDGQAYPDGTVVLTRDGRFNSIFPPTINAALATFLGLDQLNSSNTTGATSAATAPLPGSGSNPGPAVGNRASGTYANGNGVGPNNTPFYSTQVATFGTTTISNSRGVAYPFWMPVALSPAPPNFAFNGNAVGKWVRFRFLDADYNTTTGPNTTAYYNPFYPNDYWLLESVTLTNGFDSGTVTTLPGVATVGRSNAYAFLNTLSPGAQSLLASQFGKSNTAGGGAGVDTFYGQNPCLGFTAVRKVWAPQIKQVTTNTSETMRVVAGLKGRFGRDWRWDGSFSYGSTDSASASTDVATTIRLAFAMDAVIDDRPTINGAANPTFGQPVCRVNRDGPPLLDTSGRPLSNPEGLAALAAGCRPINIFGNSYASTSTVFGNNYNPAATQQQAIDYAFVETSSSGKVTQKSLTLSLNGTLWEGWGAGPLTSAFGVDVREDATNNKGSTGDFYVRADLSRSWQDAYGGKTTTTEPYAEFNMPLVSGVPGINLLSANLGVRYSSQKNEGGAGTTGEKSTQNLFIWKGQTVFEPFDWLRFRLSRSRDLRAATYRDLFRYNPAIPDSQLVVNPWRDRTPTSTENQQDRYGQVTVGNPNLKPETSDTLTVGLVLSPGGWAQGMRISIDYSDISIKNAIATSFRAANPVNECFAESGNVAAQYSGEDGSILNPGQAINSLFDPTNPACQDLTFAAPGDDGRPYQDLISFNASRPSNGLPVERKDINLSLSYLFPLSRAFEDLPGSLSLTIRAVRALEASGVQQNSNAQGFFLPGPGFVRLPNPDACGARYDAMDPENSRPAYGVRINGFQNGIDFPNGFYSNRYTCVNGVGQIRMDPFVAGVAASPKWTGSFSAAYILDDLTATLSARYVGGAFINRGYGDSPGDTNYQNANGQFLNGSIDNNWVKPYLNFALNGSYKLQVADVKQFEVFGSISNLFNKNPPFAGSSGSSAGPGVDIYGRAYRMGVRLKF